MPYHLHYSKQHQKAAKENVSLYCDNMQGVDLDLTAHIMVVYQRGIALYGKELTEVFQVPTRKDYLKSVWYDIENSLTMVTKDPVSTILNLCRTLAYVREETFLSKKEGGEWALGHCSQHYTAMLNHILKAYQAGSIVVPTALMIQFVQESLDELAGHVG